MDFYNDFKLIDDFNDELFKYKYLDILSISEREYINYLICKIENIILKIIKYGDKKEIIYLGNKLFELWVNYDIPFYEEYFDMLNT